MLGAERQVGQRGVKSRFSRYPISGRHGSSEPPALWIPWMPSVWGRRRETREGAGEAGRGRGTWEPGQERGQQDAQQGPRPGGQCRASPRG